jgi:predicted CoA-binding protein
MPSQAPRSFREPATIARILREARVVAIVGLSADPQKASHFVATYLLRAGYRVIPVSPKGGVILGQPVVSSLADIDVPVDVVDVFRPAKDCPAVVEQAISVGARAVWIQLGIVSPEAAERAASAGLAVVMDRCIKMEHGRLSGGLHHAGMNTGVISARKARIGLQA